MPSPNKRVIDKIVEIVKYRLNTHKVIRTIENIVELTGCGEITGKDCLFTRKDIGHLSNYLHNIDVNIDTYKNESTTRMDRSEQSVYEKVGSGSTLSKLMLIKSLSSEVKVNGVPLSHPKYSNIQIPYLALKSIEAKWLLVVENLDAFIYLDDLRIDFPPGVLAIYRGSKETFNAVKWTKDYCRKSNDTQLAAWCDFDLSGMVIAKDFMPDAYILPDLTQLDVLKGNSDDYDKQLNHYEKHSKSLGQSVTLQPYINYLNNRKQGFTQERLLSKNIMCHWLSNCG